MNWRRMAFRKITFDKQISNMWGTIFCSAHSEVCGLLGCYFWNTIILQWAIQIPFTSIVLGWQQKFQRWISQILTHKTKTVSLETIIGISSRHVFLWFGWNDPWMWKTSKKSEGCNTCSAVPQDTLLFADSEAALVKLILLQRSNSYSPTFTSTSTFTMKHVSSDSWLPPGETVCLCSAFVILPCVKMYMYCRE